MHDYVVDLLVFAITVCGVILTKYFIPYIKEQIKASKYATVYDMVETAVKAAEQKCQAPKQGKSKKADVLAFMSNWLETKGIHLSEDELDRIIEAIVWQMNNEE